MSFSAIAPATMKSSDRNSRSGKCADLAGEAPSPPLQKAPRQLQLAVLTAPRAIATGRVIPAVKPARRSFRRTMKRLKERFARLVSPGEGYEETVQTAPGRR